MGLLTAIIRTALIGQAATIGSNAIKSKISNCSRSAITLLIGLLLSAVIFYLFINKRKPHRGHNIVIEDRQIDFQCSHFSNKEGFAKVRAGNNYYKVHEDLENPELAAHTMDKLNTVAHQLIEHLNQKYLKTPNQIVLIKPEYRDRVIKIAKSIRSNYKTANLEENIPERSGGDTSYVIDKGDVFAMCLRDPTKNNKIDEKMNDLIFVLLHEIAHLGTDSWGHDESFWNNFKFILQEAVEAGIYKSVNYKKVGSPYCGIVITYSPLFDPKLDDFYIQPSINV